MKSQSRLTILHVLQTPRLLASFHTHIFKTDADVCVKLLVVTVQRVFFIFVHIVVALTVQLFLPSTTAAKVPRPKRQIPTQRLLQSALYLFTGDTPTVTAIAGKRVSSHRLL